MTDLNMLSQLKSLLLQTPHAKEITAKTHVVIRCPICGDSHNHPDDAHCYVNIEGNKPVSYYCFYNCSEGHWVNAEFLRSAGITEPTILSWLSKYNMKFIGKSYSNQERKIIQGKKQASVPELRLNSNNIDKLNKIEKRLGVQLNSNDCSELKIIVSIRDFVEQNGFTVNVKDKWFNVLNKKYIGFLSADNSYLVMRNMYGNDFRYVNYPVFKNSNDWGSKSFLIPGNIDIMAENIDFYVTEGVFDILGVYFGVTDKKRDNTIYGAVNGSSYIGFIKSVIRSGFINNINLHIISDKDKSPQFYKKLYYEISPLVKSIDLWYNQYPGEKDTGVPKEKINLVKANMSMA